MQNRRKPQRRSPFYAKTDQPTKRVKFISVADGDLVQMGATSIPGTYVPSPGYPEQFMARFPHTFLGFKPSTGPKAAGWIVVLVDDEHEASQPVKHRLPRRLKAVG